MTSTRTVLATPIGAIEILEEDGRLKGLGFTRARPTGTHVRSPLGRTLARYFRGEAVDFRDIPLDLDTATAFERRVYNATRRIPFGRVASYGQIARAIGNPRASRAVGQALGKNPIGIVIPCHRVVASDGSLGGYTGGIEYKRRLLRLEGALP